MTATPASTELQLLPAVDIVGGQAVQLVQGVAGTGGEFGDPYESAMRWQREGAQWLHLVDLDAAFSRGSNYDLIASIIERLDLQVELLVGFVTRKPWIVRWRLVAVG